LVIRYESEFFAKMVNGTPRRPPTWPPVKRKMPRQLSNAAKVAGVRKRPTTWLRQPALLGGRADRGPV